jgi:pyridoxal 5'-phosphate synthase pdxT subunit
MKVGVLALQGDVREHISSLIACGVDAVPVRRESEIQSIDALVFCQVESQQLSLNYPKFLESTIY